MPIAERALLLDPLSVLPHMNIGIIHMLAGDQPSAEAQFRHVLAMNPKFLRAMLFLGASVGLRGKHDESIRIVTRAGRTWEPLAVLCLGARHGDRDGRPHS